MHKLSSRTMACLSFRGLHYDLARGNCDSLSSLRRLIRFTAECGLNELVLYMEDLWLYRSHPRLASVHAYDLADMRRLAEYAAAKGVDLIPSLTTLGHAAHILAKPGYQHLAFPGWGGDFNVLDARVYDLFADLFDEVLPHFGSPYVFINGDEVNLSHLSPAAKAAARKRGLGSLYGRGMGQLAKMIVSRGRRPIIWHDMLLHHPEALAYIPKQTIIAFWYYDHQSGFPAVEYFCRRGFDVIAAPGLMHHGGGTPDYARALPNIEMHAREAAAHANDPRGKCMGLMTTIWEKLPWRESLSAIYATGRWAENPALNRDEVLEHFASDVFGAGSPRLGQACCEASRHAEHLALATTAIGGSHSERETAALRSVAEESREKLSTFVWLVGKVKPVRNADLYPDMKAVARRMAAFRPRRAAPKTAEPPLLSPPLVNCSDLACRIVTAQTPYGHELVVLTNGLIAVALLPEFGASMIEWVLLGEKPWSIVSSGYQRWAAAETRRRGDPGLGSPWDAVGIGGWRETIFYNARLNPSSLWGRPFGVRVIHRTAREIAVECVGENEVARIRRVVRLFQGKRQIAIDTTATNHIGPCVMALQPNVGHRFVGATAPLLALKENAGGGTAVRPLLDHDGTKLFSARGMMVRVESPCSGEYLQLRFRPGEVARFLMDVGAEGFTLEPFGAIRRCGRGCSVRLRLDYEFGLK